MKKIIVFFLTIFAISTASERIPAKVISVTDGDTIKVTINGKTEKIRLIGIDTPESRINRRAQLQAKKSRKDPKEIVKMGKLAKKHLLSYIAPGDTVYLEFDVQKRDKYGRLLAYVWINGIMVNEKMVCDGYAYVLTIPPNVKYADRFRKCFSEATEYGFGLWKKERRFDPYIKSNRENNSFECGKKRYCSQMNSCEEAMFYLNVCGLRRLDGDGDGVPCERLCK